MLRTVAIGLPTRVVIIAFFAVIVLPGAIFASVLISRFAQAERSRFQQEAREVASTAASVLDQHIRGWQATLQTLGTSENLRSGNLEAFYRQALAVKTFIGADIGLRDLDGQQLVNTRQVFGRPLPLTPMGVDRQIISSQKPYVADVFTGAIANEPLVAVVVPVSIGGVPRYLLHVSAETKLFYDLIRTVPPPGWFVAVGDRAGVYVTRSEQHEAFTGRPGVPAFLERAVGRDGTFVGQSAHGENILVGYARSEVSDWLIAANIRQSVIERPLRDALWTLVAGGATALLIASVLAVLLWRLIETPLKALTAASSKLGQFSSPIVAPTRLREFVALRDAMSEASSQLSANSAELEGRIQARTVELERANERLRQEGEERQRIEAMLAQSQKMEAIGNLTGGVAHDFNNLLQVVSGNLELLSREADLSEKGRVRLANAMSGVSRGAQLASQLLAFGRRQALAPKAINVGRLIRGMDDLVRRSIGEAIEVETVIAGGLWNTFADPTNLENAILNLAINARDAMEGAGRLTIEAGNAFLDDAYVARHTEVTAGQYVVVSVTDTGSGMTPEVLAKVFEPFFSTKPVGKGTGLGLSMVYGFVKQSGGHVKIYSEVGLGTTIKIYLPRSMSTEETVTPDDMRPIVGGTETVLVVEDDDAVRETVIGLLSELGYNVLRASDAQSALSIVESGVAIDLLFTDVVMPGPLKSADLARQAKSRLPHLTVLFTSGYTENSIVHGGRLDDGVSLLSKPYTREALARKIRQVLSEVPQPEAEDRRAPAIVLLVEDDALIRMDTASLIESLGFVVVEAATADEALGIAGTRAIDRLVTDLGLPDMDGVELARRVREMHPDVSVVFATGRHEVLEVEMDSRTKLLTKPYGARDLERALA
ncbi:response regulator [Bosea sp. (in: a-proteobacteria)]|uniref:response regulator n=1 Tax=Bosea sp. (in: a-proteobacteria) TaxID=1871050 RepID=UPI002B463D03|nr:response regulator [Bosea sp. (in: a-proteobacteria)]WRH60095.1 MAG: response regulator [Bosea sp. (in: a-proteobacteria)]